MLQCTNPVKHILARRVATTTVRCTMYEIDEQNVNVQSQHPKLWSSTYMDQDIRTSPFHCWQPHPREYTSTGTSHQSPLWTCTKQTVREQRSKHSHRSRGHTPSQGRDPNRSQDTLVPDLEDTVPRPGGNCHAVFIHTETTHSVVVTSQHTCKTNAYQGKGVYSSQWNSPHNYGTPLVNGITQCYLPPDRGDGPAFTPTGQVGTRFIDPMRMKGRVGLVGWLHTETVYPSTDGHPSRY